MDVQGGGGVKVEPPIFFQNTDNKNAKRCILTQKSVPKKFAKPHDLSPVHLWEIPFWGSHFFKS